MDFAVTLDVEHAADIQYMHFAVPAEGDGARRLAESDAVVEEFVMHLFVGGQCPGEKHLGHAGESFDIVREQVIDGLVAADFEAAVPGAFDGGVGRRDHEKQINEAAKTRQQIAAGDIRCRRKRVKAEAVDQQMRHQAAFGLACHRTVELVVDDLQLVTTERAGVFVSRTQR